MFQIDTQNLNQSFIAFLFYCSMYIHQLSANLISPPWCTAFDTYYYFNNESLCYNVYSAVFKCIWTQLDERIAFQFSGWICSFNISANMYMYYAFVIITASAQIGNGNKVHVVLLIF